MNILTLTTYSDYNYGASLQAYALQNYLIKEGHDAKLIRLEFDYLMRYYSFGYVNPESRLNKNFLTRMIYRIAKWCQRRTTLKRKAVFDYFNHSVLRETAVFKTGEDLFKNPPEADLYLCGSDQIWNVLYPAGQDPVFYLDFVQHGRKASYAASFAYLDIPNGHFNRIKNSLKSFDAVSVREWQGKELVEQMGIQASWVLDPVFLLSVDDWKSLTGETGILSYENDSKPTGKYLLIYDFEGNERIKSFSIEYAKKNHLKIYAIVDRFPLSYADRNFKNAGPVDFVRMIMNCDVFVSNSFHGSVFSIIFHKPFYVFNRNRHSVNSRMESLLTLFQIQDALLDTIEKEKDASSVIFDWERIDSIKSDMLLVSQKYLKSLGV